MVGNAFAEYLKMSGSAMSDTLDINPTILSGSHESVIFLVRRPSDPFLSRWFSACVFSNSQRMTGLEPDGYDDEPRT